jgi:tetratricopeptide (TPR) repeat protein
LTDALVWAGHFKEAVETSNRGLASMDSGISAERVRLLAALGHALAATAGSESVDDALTEALSVASQLGDSRLVARVLGARSVANFHCSRLVEGANDGFESVRSVGSAASPWQHATQLRILQQTLLCLGRVEEAVRIGDELEPMARKIGQSYSVALCLDTRAWIDFGKVPDLADLETGIQLFSKSARDTRFPLWKSLSVVQLSLLDFFRGNWASALSHAQACCRYERGNSMEGLGIGMLFRQMAYARDRDGALAVLDVNRGRLPRSSQQNTRGSWWMLMLVMEGLIILGEHAAAAQLYSLARELIGTGSVVLWPIPRLTHTVAGLGAAAAHDWAVAENHFRIALQQAESFPQELEKAEIRRFRAMMLLDRAAPSDREKALRLLGEALKTYSLVGMPRHLEMTQSLME